MTAANRDELSLSGAGQGPAAEQIEVLRAGRKLLVRVSTPLDVMTSRPLLARLEAEAAQVYQILIDLRRCDFIDSDGVRALWAVHGRMAARQGELRLVVEPGSRVMRTLRLLRLDEVLHLYDSAAEAWTTSEWERVQASPLT